MHRLGLVLLLVACGGTDSGGEPDAGGGGVLTAVRVVDDGMPVAGARVVFHGADGAVDGVVVAGDSGLAAHPLAAGGMITVAYPGEIELVDGRVQLVTYAGVEPGAPEVTVELPSFDVAGPPEAGETVGRLRVELAPREGAGQYVIHLGCTDMMTAELITEVEVPEACLGSDGRVDVVVDAYTPPDLPSRLATAFARGVEIAEGETSSVAVGAWVDPLPTVDVEVRDLPPEATNAFAIPVPVADGLAFQPVLADAAAVSAETQTLSPGFLAGFADEMDLETRLNAGVGSLTTEILFGAQVLDVTAVTAAGMLPFVSDVAFTEGAIDWRASGQLEAAGADAIFVRLESSRADGVVTRRHRWTFLLPPGSAPRVELPELPAELEEHAPRRGDDYLEPGVVALDADWIAGWPAFLAGHGTRFLDDACVPVGYHARALVTRAGAFVGPQLQR